MQVSLDHDYTILRTVDDAQRWAFSTHGTLRNCLTVCALVDDTAMVVNMMAKMLCVSWGVVRIVDPSMSRHVPAIARIRAVQTKRTTVLLAPGLYPTLAARSWTQEDIMAASIFVGNATCMLAVFEDLVLRDDTDPMLFTDVCTRGDSALCVRKERSIEWYELCASVRRGVTQIVNTRVVVSGVTWAPVELVVRRARGVPIGSLESSVQARVNIAYAWHGLPPEWPRGLAWASGEELHKGRPLEAYGIDDDATIEFRYA